jgi:hypothetical protein
MRGGEGFIRENYREPRLLAKGLLILESMLPVRLPYNCPYSLSTHDHQLVSHARGSTWPPLHSSAKEHLSLVWGSRPHLASASIVTPRDTS